MTARRTCVLFFFGTALVVGCTSEESPSPYRITRTTTDRTMLGAKHPGAAGAVIEWDGPNANVDLQALVREVKIVARHEATLRQREVGRAGAATTVRRLPQTQRQAVKSREVRYLAIETERNAKSRGKKSVMIWDVTTAALADHNVYDVAETPNIGARCRFDTYAAQYVGSGY